MKIFNEEMKRQKANSVVNPIVDGVEITRKIDEIRETPYIRFRNLGLKTMSDKMNLAIGFPIYVGGYDSHGKTQFIFEIQLQLSELYGYKHLIFSGEVGTIEQSYIDLYTKYGGKSFLKYDGYGNELEYYQNDEEALKSREFINRHFLIVDRQRVTDGFTIDKMMDTLDDILQDEFNDFENVNTISIDSWYEIERENLVGTDRQLEKFLQKIYSYGLSRRITFIISSHIGAGNHATKMLEVKGTNQKYPHIPTKYNWTGGMMWSRMGFQLVNIYKPHPEVEYGTEPTQKGEVWIDVEKSKPYGVGHLGRFKIFLDWKTNRFYEMIDGEKKFSRNWKEDDAMVVDAIVPNNDFIKPPEQPTQTIPDFGEGNIPF